MLRNQGGVGGVGTYWVTLVAGGLIESDSGTLYAPLSLGPKDPDQGPGARIARTPPAWAGGLH